MAPYLLLHMHLLLPNLFQLLHREPIWSHALLRLTSLDMDLVRIDTEVEVLLVRNFLFDAQRCEAYFIYRILRHVIERRIAGGISVHLMLLKRPLSRRKVAGKRCIAPAVLASGTGALPKVAALLVRRQFAQPLLLLRLQLLK